MQFAHGLNRHTILKLPERIVIPVLVAFTNQMVLIVTKLPEVGVGITQVEAGVLVEFIDQVIFSGDVLVDVACLIWIVVSIVCLAVFGVFVVVGSESRIAHSDLLSD